MTREDAISAVIRRAFEVCGDYDRLIQSGEYAQFEVVSGAIAAVSGELETCLNVARNAAQIEAISKSPDEAVAMLTHGFGHLLYVATLACAIAMQMPGLDRVPAPPSEATH